MDKLVQDKTWIIYLATYPPRECGIATFTADLVKNSDQLFAPREETRVVAMNTDPFQAHHYPPKVIFQIEQNNPENYREVAKKLNQLSQVKLINIQHEFGIFGADYGKNLLVFLEEIKKLVIITCHTVLPSPTEEVKLLVGQIAARADRLVVMTHTSKELLQKIYGVPENKIRVIHHGIHPLSFTDSRSAKTGLRLPTNKKILSTFGLLGPGKGIEYGIAALPAIIKTNPNVLYLIIGATHPVVLKNSGETYRQSLIDLAKKIGVQDHVLFYNEYLKTEELLKFLQATDIYLSLSQNPDQAVSGTLTYALGAGRPVISTPFMQAKELITAEVGKLVDFNDSVSITQAVADLLTDDKKLTEMSRAAYFRTRGMIWPNVALSYMREYIELSPELGKKEKNLPNIKLQHLNKLTDNFGIFQFAILDEPDPAWGYTLDDNARALVTVAWYHQGNDGLMAKRLASTYLDFITRAAKDNGGFNNYFTDKREPHTERNSAEDPEDAESRAIWALAVAATSNLPEELCQRAKTLLKEQCQKMPKATAPRAMAFRIKALALWQASEPNDLAVNLMTEYTDRLLKLYDKNSDKNWQWFEQALTYSNALLPEALLLAYKVTGNYLYFKAGKATLDFLLSQTFHGDVCSPVGQAGWFKRGETKNLYDQQPEEVSALVLCLRTMFDLNGDNTYYQWMLKAFDWFLGNNLLGQVVYSPMTGGCYDGVGQYQINLNQGAESTISYLLARLAVEAKSPQSE